MITLIKTVRTVAATKPRPRAAHRAFLRGLAFAHGHVRRHDRSHHQPRRRRVHAELLAFYSGALVVLFVVRAALYVTNYAQTQFRARTSPPT